MPAVFISYRRDDTAPYAGRVWDRLSERFGRDRVFLDIDGIEPGQDFIQVLEQRIAGCDAVVVLIGDDWLASADPNGRRRLDDEGDFVRQEITVALGRGIPVIPVLVEGAKMPKASDLPASISRLARRNALEISDARFHDDVDRLIEALKKAAGAGTSKRIVRALAIGVPAIAAIGLGIWTFAPRGEGGVRLRHDAGTVSRADAGAMLARRGFYSSALNEAGTGIGNKFETRVAQDIPVVIDRTAGLMWEKHGSRRLVAGGAHAAEYARTARARGLAGFNDWRLPTLEEAMSILCPKKHAGFHLDPVFDRLGAPFIWTSDRDLDGRGWVVYYGEGRYEIERLEYHAYIRLVRRLARRGDRRETHGRVPNNDSQ